MPIRITSPKKRPTCVECGRDMVFAVIEAAPHVFQTWVCDCRQQPPGVATDIVRAREWDDQALEFELVHTEQNEIHKGD